MRTRLVRAGTAGILLFGLAIALYRLVQVNEHAGVAAVAGGSDAIGGTASGMSLFQRLASGGDVWQRDPANPYFFDYVATQLGGRRDRITREEFAGYIQRGGTLAPPSPQPAAPGETAGSAVENRGRKPAGPSDVDSWAKQLFQRLDQNGDGLLNIDEMSTTLRAELEQWDTNGDGLIDPQEFQRYFRARVERYGQDQPAAGPPTAVGNWQTRPLDMGSTSPSRPLPVGLPAWYRQLDPTGTGQVSLHQWKASGRPAALFEKLDRNGDGLLTADEAVAAARSGLDRKVMGSFIAADPRKQAAANQPAPAPPPRPATPTQMEQRFVAAAAQPSAPAAAPAPAPAPAPAAPSGMPLARTPSSLSGLPGYLGQREVQNELAVEEGHTNVLFLGDSITDWLKSGVGQPVWQQCFAPMAAQDFAVAGITTSEVLWQVDMGQVAAVTPRVVVLMIGTNNLALGQQPADVAAGISDIVSGIQEQLPQTKVLLLSILPRGQSPADPLRGLIADVNQRIAQLDDGGQVQFLDIGGMFLQPDGSISREVMGDYLHPTLWGYQLYTASIWNALNAALAP